MANQPPSITHDSSTCQCDVCRWANENATLDRSELRADLTRDHQYASLSVVRAAVADVLDAGDSENAGEWLFYSTEPDWRMDDRRARFMDAVCARITALQSPPHNMDAGLRERLAVREDQR